MIRELPSNHQGRVASALAKTRSEKAFWRAARALFATEKLTEAIDCCARGLKINPGNEDFATMKAKIEKKKEDKERLEAEKKERQRRKKGADSALKRAFVARGL